MIRSRRKTVALQVLGLNDVVVRAPMRMSNREIEEFVQQNMDWQITQAKSYSHA